MHTLFIRVKQVATAEGRYSPSKLAPITDITCNRHVKRKKTL